MRVSVTGATGLIGRAVVEALRTRGDEVTTLSRDADRARSLLGDGVTVLDWPDPNAEPPPSEALSGRDAVVHLASEPVAQRWTEDAKRKIRDSRVLSTHNVVAGIAAAEPRPRVLVAASATGLYGPRGDEPVDEAAPAADDFLAQVCADRESEARAAEQHGVRVVPIRTGLVLTETGGALAGMLRPHKLGVGGPVAGGRQHVPWIHLDDEVGAILFCLDNERVSGPVNLVAPEPATNKQLSKALGRALGRPTLGRVPGPILKLALGEGAQVMTTGARVVPRRLQELGYEFKQPTLSGALEQATGTRG